VAFHANGTGGRSMERLIEEGLLQGVIDISTQELTGYVCRGLFDAGPDRLVAAARWGSPRWSRQVALTMSCSARCPH
jgi:uncharacterized protein (UPF0261 family)